MKPEHANQPTSRPNQVGSKLRVISPTLSLERQPKESVPAFDAWLCYLKHKSAGTGGITVVAKELKKSTALIGRWSSRHQWKERYRLYQNQQQLLQEREQRKAMADRARDWAKKRISLREEGFIVGEAMVKRGQALLNLPIYDREIKGEVDVNGKLIPTLTILNFNQHPKDAVAFIKEGIKLMRLSADMTTENIGTPLDEDIDLESLEEEELLALAEQLKEVRAEQLKSGIV